MKYTINVVRWSDRIILFIVSCHHMFSKNLFETLAVSSGIFILLVILHFFLGLINVDALVYYPLFISGIFINQIAYSSKKIVDEHFLKKILFSSLILISVIFLVFVFREFHQLTFPFFNPQISLFLKPQILLLCAMIPLCTIYLIFTHLFIKIRGKIMVIHISDCFCDLCDILIPASVFSSFCAHT